MLTSSTFDQTDPQPLPIIHITDDEDEDGEAIDGNILGGRSCKNRVCLYVHLIFSLAYLFFFHIVPRLPREVTTLAGQLGQLETPDLVRRFLYQQENPESLIPLLVNGCEEVGMQ